MHPVRDSALGQYGSVQRKSEFDGRGPNEVALMANVSIGLIVVTGLALIIAGRQSFLPGAADGAWPFPFVLKIILWA